MKGIRSKARRAWRVAVPVLLLLPVSCGDALGPTAAQFTDEPAPEVVAFVDVNLVTMDADRFVPRQTVVVREGLIEAIGPSDQVPVPQGAFVIEGQGRYLVPGLVDMHVHVTSRTFAQLHNDFMLWLANGVTTVRVMWGSSGIVAERERIELGEVLGPALLVASPGIDGPDGTWTDRTPAVRNAAEARERVALHATTGYDFIKVYNDLDLPMYRAIIDEAERQGLPVVGHVPGRVGVARVQAAGQLTLEHFIGFKIDAATRFNGGVLDLARVRELAAASRDAGVWHTPTITVDALSRARVQAIQAGDELPYVSPGMRGFFEDGFYHGFAKSVSDVEERHHRAMTKILHDASARLLVGTDAGFGWILPGYSIHDELWNLVEAGLSPYEALRAATASPARAVDQASTYGRIVVGLRADLLLLTQNPLDSLDALRESSGTMVRGRWLARGTLQRRLGEIRAEYAGSSASAPRLSSARRRSLAVR